MVQHTKPALAGKIETSSEPPMHSRIWRLSSTFFAAKTRFQSIGTDAKNIGVDELFKTQGTRKGERLTWNRSRAVIEIIC